MRNHTKTKNFGWNYWEKNREIFLTQWMETDPLMNFPDTLMTLDLILKEETWKPKKNLNHLERILGEEEFVSFWSFEKMGEDWRIQRVNSVLGLWNSL